jgi:protein-tyrosine phosphatase
MLSVMNTFSKKGGLFFGKQELTDDILRLRDMGILFQVNWNSLDKNPKLGFLSTRE